MTATAMLENARAEGKEEGEAIGLEKGRAEEREKAKQEKLEIAQKLLEDGMTIENISKYTALTQEQIEQLKAKQK